MSSWTHVNGTITVSIPETYNKPEKVSAYVEYALSKLIKNGHRISGSEDDCNIYINPSENIHCWSSDTGNGYTTAILTLNGGLRDREPQETHKEILDFIWNLRRYVTIDSCFIDMYCDWCDTGNIYATGDHSYRHTISGSKYVDLVMIKTRDDFNDETNDQYFRIQEKNFERYNNCVSTYDFIELYDRLSKLNPKNFEKLMSMGRLDREIDWDFTPRVWEWRDEHGLKPYNELRLDENIDTNGWFETENGIPGKEYNGYDWVLVKYKEADTGWENPLPHIAEYRSGRWWFMDADSKEFSKFEYYKSVVILKWKPMEV